MTTPPAFPAAPPPLPPFALKVGLVGNRRFGKRGGTIDPALAELQLTRARAACAEAWPEIVRGMERIRGERLPAINEHPPGAARTLFSRVSGLFTRAVESGAHDAPPERVADFFAPGPALLTVLSSLAAGTDQFGARAALDHGQALRDRAAASGGDVPVAIQLESILPFGEADYPGPTGTPEAAFTTAEAAELYALADGPHCVQTVRLDGLFASPVSPTPDDPINQGYRQARDFILQNSDLLVAVLDPQAAGSAAGTLETVERALNGGVPVLAILVSAHDEEARVGLYRLSTELTPISELLAQARPLSARAWCEPLEGVLRYLLALPQSGDPINLLALAPDDPDIQAPYEKKKRVRAYEEARHQLEVFLGRRTPDGLGHSPLRASLFAWGWSLVTRVSAVCARKHGFEEHRIPSPQKVDAPLTVPPYARAYERAETLSKMYMDIYRGAFPLAFLLAGTATAAAVAMMIVAYFTHHDPSLWIVVPLGGLKIGILVFLLWLEHTANRQRWQEHAAEYRYMAELLRPMQWLAPLGAAVPAVEMPTQYATLDPIQGWMHWLFRAMARSVPCVCRPAAPGKDDLADLRDDPAGFRKDDPAATTRPRHVAFSTADADRALRDGATVWLESQRAYHWEAAQRHHQIENGLERLAKGLLIFVLASAVAALALELHHGLSHAHTVHGGAHNTHAALEEAPPGFPAALLQPAVVVLTGLAAALPAFIAALTGVIFQSEAKRLELRSEAMFHGLKARQKILARFLEALPKMQAERGGATRETAQRLRTLAGLMIAETGDWKALYQMQDIRAG